VTASRPERKGAVARKRPASATRTPDQPSTETAVAPAPKRSGPRAAGRGSTVDNLPPDDANLREFIADFSAAGALMRRLRRSLADALDLSAAEHSVMLGLWYCERRGTTSVRELADHLHVAAAHVTAELGKLSEAGLVEKTPNEADKRAVNLRLTQKGHKLLDRLAPILREVNLSLLAGVSHAEMGAAQRLLKRIVEQAPDAIRVAEFAATLDRHALAAASSTRSHREK
jgi:DNA-binding MarR family transcriptional regulator